MPSFEFKTINAFYEDDIARYLIAEKITKKENINIHNLLKSILINRDIDFNKIDIVDLTEDEIEEIRIEGHTSSEWNKDDDNLQAYFKNMSLSQARARSVLEYCMLLDSMENYRDFLIEKATANGLSYSHRIIEDGKENYNKSRRVEFKIKTTAEAHMDKILEVGGLNEK